MSENWRQDWWEEVEPGGRVLLWRKDGMVLAQSSPATYDPQAGGNVVAGFTARRPTTLPPDFPATVQGDTPEEVTQAALQAWGPANAAVFSARPGMVVYHDRTIWTFTQAEESAHSILPRHRNQRVLRYALVPYAEQNGRRHAEPFSSEMPVKLWPFRFLILVP